MTETTRLRELTVRYALKRDGDGHAIVIGHTLTTPRDSAAILVPLLQKEPSEVFAMLCLSTKRRVIAYHEVGRGTLDTVLVTPREVFKAAILANAGAIIIGHSVPGHRMRLMCPESLCAGAGAHPLSAAVHRSSTGT